MATTQNLIKFKYGTTSQLQALTADKIEDGAFYLTIDSAKSEGIVRDSSKLYIGRNGKVVPVNQGITTVNSVADLASGSGFQAGDFAYVANGNIFAIYNGKDWLQVNNIDGAKISDFKIDTLYDSETGTATLRTTFKQGGVTQTPIDVKIAGENGVKIKTDNSTKTVTISGDQYDLGITKSSGTANVNEVSLDLTSGSNHNSSVTLAADGTYNTLSVNDTTKKVTVIGKNQSIGAPIFTNGTGSGSVDGFTLNIPQGDDNTPHRGTFDPTITLGNQKDVAYHFTNGSANLPVYTKQDIDKLFRDLDALTFIGGVKSDGSAVGSGLASGNGVTGITDAHVGDVFKIADDGCSLTVAQSADGVAHTLKTGDTIIAVGSEDDNGLITKGSLKFVYIPSGDETDTTYNFAPINNGVRLSGSTDTSINSGELSFNASTENTDIEISDNKNTAGHSNTITIKHKTYDAPTATDGTAQSQGNRASITVPVISKITTNNGHVTGIETTEYTLTDTNASLAAGGVTNSVAVADNTATITTEVKLTGSDGTNRGDQKSSYSLTSSNLTVAANGSNGTQINMYWETF